VGDVTLTYAAGAGPDELELGLCVIRGARKTGGARWWNLWFRVPRDRDGQPETYAVPVIPGGAYTESGPGGKTWGLTRTGPGAWQVSPSIDVLSDADARRQAAKQPRRDPGDWHHTPAVVGVPDGEPWAI